MATAKELRDLTVDDLRRRAEQLLETLFQDRLKLRTGTLDNPNERVQHRRDLARIFTVLSEKTQPLKAGCAAARAQPTPKGEPAAGDEPTAQAQPMRPSLRRG